MYPEVTGLALYAWACGLTGFDPTRFAQREEYCCRTCRLQQGQEIRLRLIADGLGHLLVQEMKRSDPGIRRISVSYKPTALTP